MLGNVPLITARDPHHDNQTFQRTIQKYCSYKSVPTYSFPFVDWADSDFLDTLNQ